MAFIYPLHPALVHFAIALSFTGAVVIVVGLLRRNERWTGCGRLGLLLGWGGTWLAIVSGLIDQSAAPDTPAVTTTLNQHITAGIALLIVLGLALYWPLRYRDIWTNPKRQWIYYALLAAGVVLVVIEGWLGGRLVYTLGVGVASP